MKIILSILVITLRPFVALNKYLEGVLRLNVLKQKSNHPRSVANSAEGTHAGRITRILASKVEKRNLLVSVKKDSSFIEACGASCLPQGLALSAGEAGDAIAVALLGSAESTLLMLSSGPIKVGEEVFTATGGRVQGYPKEKGSYYRIGQALNSVQSRGMLVEVDPYSPQSIQIV